MEAGKINFHGKVTYNLDDVSAMLEYERHLHTERKRTTEEQARAELRMAIEQPRRDVEETHRIMKAKAEAASVKQLDSGKAQVQDTADHGRGSEEQQAGRIADLEACVANRRAASDGSRPNSAVCIAATLGIGTTRASWCSTSSTRLPVPASSRRQAGVDKAGPGGLRLAEEEVPRPQSSPSECAR